MKNLRELFTLYPFGIDNFGAWVDHHKAMHAKHPLDCAEFGAEWLWRWSEAGRLLEYSFLNPPRVDARIRTNALNSPHARITILDHHTHK